MLPPPSCNSQCRVTIGSKARQPARRYRSCDDDPIGYLFRLSRSKVVEKESPYSGGLRASRAYDFDTSSPGPMPLTSRQLRGPEIPLFNNATSHLGGA